MKKSLSAASASILGISSLAIPNVAMASLQDCGTAPSGATLTFSNGVCEAQFSTAGTFSFTVPSGATDLAAIVLGAGGGAYVETFRSEGYTGNGGDVRYVNLAQSASAGSVLPVQVGSGGTSQQAPTDGQASTITLGSTTYLASGGEKGAGLGYNYCILDGSTSTYLGLGEGAGGPALLVDTDKCADPAPGLNPSTDSSDNYSNTVPTIFSTLNVEFGVGGYLVETPATLVQGPGQGGSIEMNLSTPAVVNTLNGSHGLVALRWKPAIAPATTATPAATSAPAAAAPRLATTGQEFSQMIPAGLATVILLSFGVGILTIANRAKKRRIQGL